MAKEKDDAPHLSDLGGSRAGRAMQRADAAQPTTGSVWVSPQRRLRRRGRRYSEHGRRTCCEEVQRLVSGRGRQPRRHQSRIIELDQSSFRAASGQARRVGPREARTNCAPGSARDVAGRAERARPSSSGSPRRRSALSHRNRRSGPSPACPANRHSGKLPRRSESCRRRHRLDPDDVVVCSVRRAEAAG